MKKIPTNLARPLVFFMLSVLPLAVAGQFKFESAEATALDSSEVKWEISAITTAVVQKDITSVTLLDARTGDKLHIDDIIYFPSSVTGEVDGFQIPTLGLSRGGNYVLIASVIKKKPTGEFDKLETGTATINIPAAKPAAPDATAKRATMLKPLKSKEKKDSDVFIAGDFTAQHGSKPVYSIEVKIAPRFGPGMWDYSPFFNLNASTSPKADPDSMNFGFKATRSIPFEYDATNAWKPRLTSLYVSMAGKFEAERDFENVNLTFDPMLDFIISTIPLGKKATLTFDPFIGAELGRNLKSPLPAAEGDGIARILGGGHVLVDIPLEKGIDNITLSADYTRRMLLSRELRFKANDDNTLSLIECGKHPRDFFESKLEFGVNKFFSPYIAYDWGELPPSFKLVDHRVRIGFIYKFRLSNK